MRPRRSGRRRPNIDYIARSAAVPTAIRADKCFCFRTISQLSRSERRRRANESAVTADAFASPARPRPSAMRSGLRGGGCRKIKSPGQMNTPACKSPRTRTSACALLSCGSFAKRKPASTEDRREAPSEDPSGYDALNDARGAAPVAALEKVITEGPRRVGVLYGANHMHAVIRCLMGTHGYRIANARWLTVVTC